MRLSPFRHGWRKVLKWSGRKRFDYLKEIVENEKKDGADLDKIQFEKLKRILWHAFLNIPHYTELFKELKITPDDIRSIKDLTYIPILKKEMIRDNLTQFKATNIQERDLLLNHTGGSTGKPLSFYSDRDLFEKMEAGFMRSLNWAGYRFGDPMVYIWGAQRDLKGLGSLKYQVKSFLSNKYYIGAYKYSPEDMERWLSFLKKKKIKFIYGYASVLSYFSHFIKSEKFEAPKMKAIFTSAERLLPEMRKSIGEVFNCKVYDQYGSREVICIASECEEGNMHILTDFVHVEFIKDETLRMENPPYKIIVTSFVNLGTPFIRYDIGDYAFPKEGNCDCGRSFPLMEMSIGRINEHILTSDGRLIYPSYFIHLLDGIGGIQNFQFRQKNLRQMELYIVGDKIELAEKKRIDNLEKKIKNELDPGMSLWISYVNVIPPASNGKHQYIVSDMLKQIVK